MSINLKVFSLLFVSIIFTLPESYAITVKAVQVASSRIKSPGVVVGSDTLVVGAFDGSFCGNALSGSEKFTLQTGGYINGIAAVGSDLVAVASSDGTVYIVDSEGNGKSETELAYGKKLENRAYTGSHAYTGSLGGQYIAIASMGRGIQGEYNGNVVVLVDGWGKKTTIDIAAALNVSPDDAYISGNPFQAPDGPYVFSTNNKTLLYDKNLKLVKVYNAGVWNNEVTFLPSGGVASCGIGDNSVITNASGEVISHFSGVSFRGQPTVTRNGTIAIISYKDGSAHFFDVTGKEISITKPLVSSRPETDQPTGSVGSIFAPPVALNNDRIIIESLTSGQYSSKPGVSTPDYLYFYAFDSEGKRIPNLTLRFAIPVGAAKSAENDIMRLGDSDIFAIQVRSGDENTVYFVDSKTMLPRGNFSARGAVSKPVLLSDGQWVFSGADGFLYYVKL